MEKEIIEIKKILDEKLDESNGARLREQLTICEAWSARVSYEYRIALKTLYEARRKVLYPKTREYTELDRTTFLAADTASQQFNVDVLKDIQEIIKKRISVGQTMLKSLTSEAEL